MKTIHHVVDIDGPAGVVWRSLTEADALAQLGREADAVVCPLRPELFGAVSTYYYSFGQTTDREVIDLLR